MFELTESNSLIINNNRITQIPKEIYKLHNLREFKIGNVCNSGSYAIYFIKGETKRLDISNFKYLHNQNNVLDLPNEIAYLQFLVNCYIPELKENYKIFDENMIIFDNLETMDFIIPQNIKYLTILFKIFPNQNILNLLNNLPVGINELYYYTAPYYSLFEPYSHWPRHVSKEDILNFKIPFECNIFLNDEQIKI